MDALEHFGCCSKTIVPDNLKSAVSKACRYEPDINPTYAEFARHYKTTIFPARPYRPKFEILDKPHALPLPDKKYEFAQWKKVRVNINYHVEFDKHSYSVPYTFIQQELEIRATNMIIEVYKGGQRICSHKRSYKDYGYTTEKSHMPPAHHVPASVP